MSTPPADESVMQATLPPAQTRAPASKFPAGIAVLAATLLVMPVAGIPGEWVLQDTLKSTLLAMGTLLAALMALVVVLKQSVKANRALPTPALRWHGLLAFPLVLCAYALGSMVWSHTYLAAAEVCRWALLGVLMALCLQTLRRASIPLLVWAIHWGAVGASAWAAAQFWGGLDWFPQAAAPASTFVNRNFFAEYLVCTLPFSAYALAQVRQAHRRPLVALSLAFNLVALMMTGTRSALAALVLMGPLLVYALWRYRHALAWGQWSRGSRWLAACTVVVGVLSLGALPTSQQELMREGHSSTALQRSFLRAGSIMKSQEYTVGSFSVRASMWKSTFRMVIANPWTGVGAGAWEVHIPRYQGWNNSVETDFYAHNELLQLLGEYGLPVGGGVLAVLLAYLLWSAQTTWRIPVQGRAGQDAALRAVALCSLLALLVVSNAGFPWRLASTGALMMVSLALLASGTARTVAVSRRAVQGLVVVGVLALCGAAVVSAQAMHAESSIVGSVQLLNKLVLHPDMPAPEREAVQARAFALLQQGVHINPHYRKLTALAADQFAATGNVEAALWAQDSVAASRPYIPDVQANRVLLHSSLQHPQAAREAWEALAALQADAPRTRALDILLLRRSGKDADAAQQLRSYFAQGIHDYDLLRFAIAIGLETHDEALTTQAYRLWVDGWPAETSMQAEALALAPPAWRMEMQKR